ncbi:hypothetical protein HG264_01085 [Pseudomonas sp. gcc21]|uniref:BPSL0761 family protein n=1 Tax=Pseudomonas sp. gcc21 TaxID=2726989 RepID=UPI0014522211|nr:BPSL0761 family protein [Pseudomonas sp. gcc21]QJD57598.1 hypothetical protein HG264_01085 [Pseudomonas sp. gcc21]
MTLPYERSRAVVQTHQFLKELTLNPDLPPELRAQAEVLLRHYPEPRGIMLLAKMEKVVQGMALGDPAPPILALWQAYFDDKTGY